MDHTCSCPACDKLTLNRRGRYEICTHCGWQDEPEDDPKWQASGPNRMTLAQARENVARFGAITKTWAVRRETSSQKG